MPHDQKVTNAMNKQIALSTLAGVSAGLILSILAGCQTDRRTVGAPDSARYRLIFTATWDAATHPAQFPANAHFSPLIGTTHNSEISFWQSGQPPSPGMETMAELGATDRLRQEIAAAQAAGSAGEQISGSAFDSPGAVETEFAIEVAHPQVTVVSMLAPSPDWFVGVSALALYEDGQWVGQKEIELRVYDAGSDHGTIFTAPDADANPKQAIRYLTAPQTDFRDGLPPVGTFRFVRITE